MLCTSGFTDDVMFSYHGTGGQSGMVLCCLLDDGASGHGHWLGIGRCSPLAHWLSGQACVAYRGGQECVSWAGHASCGAGCPAAGLGCCQDGGAHFCVCFMQSC